MMKNKSRIKTLLMVPFLVAAITAAFTAPLPAEDVRPAAETVQASAPPDAEKPTGEASVAFMSGYVWRGYELSRHSMVVQPSLTVAYKGFSANLWGNLDTRPYYGETQEGKSYGSAWNETDVTLSYAKALGLVTLGGGYTYYGLGALNADGVKRADAQELFVSIGLNTLLSPTLTVYKEIDHYRNWYALLGISHTFGLSRAVSLKLAATASYLHSTYADAALFNAGAGYGGYPRFDGNAVATNDTFSHFHDGTLSLSLPVKVTTSLTLTPTISCVFPLSEDARNEMKGQGMKGSVFPADRDGSYVYGGLTAVFCF